MIGVIDYGASNLKSVCDALDRLRRPYLICREAAQLAGVRILVLPGVGQFASALRRLRTTGLDDAIGAWVSRGNPTVGICLGLQLFFEGSEEAPGEPGLGLIPGRVVRLKCSTVPHMGWNRVEVRGCSPWLSASNWQHFYFAHGYVAPMSPKYVAGTATVEGCRVPAMIESGAIRAVQFHPEKSATAGAELLDRMLTC